MRRLTILLAAVGALLLVPAAQAFANGTIKVNIEGSGSGEVSSVGGYLKSGFWEGSPPLECHGPPATGTCETELVEEEEEPGLEAIALSEYFGDSGSELVALIVEEGNDNEGKCEALVSSGCILYQETGGGNVEVTAYFEPSAAEFELTAKTGGVEGASGTVISEPAGINCAECTHSFPINTDVTLTAVPNPGSEFVDWLCGSGTGTVVEGKCTVKMTENKLVEAHFKPAAEPAEQPLTLKVNSGSGTTVSNPAGIECTGSTGKTCTAEFEEGAEVTLTASPAAGYRFYNWAACPGATNGRQCTVTMSEAKEARVNFIKTWKLTVSKSSGSEDGIFKVLPSPGVVCPYKCQDATYSFTNGQEVELTRYEPSPVRHFAGWENGTGSAAGCTGTAPCTITLTADSSIEGLFEENAKATLSVSKEGGGQASITSSPVGIYCLNSCGSASVDLYSEPTPEEVTLSWTLNAGTSSIEWTSGAGTCTGKSTSNGNCKVTMSEAHNLVAKLE